DRVTEYSCGDACRALCQRLISKTARVTSGEIMRRETATSRSIYARYGKRALDVFSSAIGLLILSPLLVIIACCVKLGSRGSVVYRQVRIGQDGRQFQILKFRSMVVDASKRGLGITVSGDG